MKLVKSLLAVLLVLTVTQIGDVQTIACDSYADEKFGPVCPFDCSNCGAVTCRDNDYVCVTGYCTTVNGPAGPQGCVFEDIARGSKNIAQISSYSGLGPYRATNRLYATNDLSTCTHTATGVSHPWWRVDFGSQHVVYAVQLYNRIYSPALDRLSFFDVRVGNTDIRTAITAGQKFTGNQLCRTYNQIVPETLTATVKPYAEILCDQPVRGRYLSIQMNEGNGISRSSRYNNVLTICEISIRGYRDFGSGGRTGDGDCLCRDANECDMAGVCDSGCKLGRHGKYCQNVIALETPTLSAHSPTTVNVQWKLFNSNQLTFIDSERGSVPLSYLVQYKPAGGTWRDFPGQSSISGSGADQFRSLTLTGLRADTQYQIRSVLMKTYNGNPEIVARSTAVTRCTVPTPVTNIQLTSSCDGADRASITVTWQASSSARCGTGSVEYVVWVKEGLTGSGTFTSHRLQNSGYTIRTLKRATLYTVRVEARNSAYPGLKSLADQTLTTRDGAPSSPENVQLSTSYSTSTGTWPNQARITVTWQRPADVGCGTPIYHVTFGRVGALGESSYGSDATSQTLLDLEPYTAYEVTVTILSGGINTDAPTETIRTAEGESSPVTDIQFSATSTTTTTVSWTKPAMPYGIITKYLVTYRRLRYLVSGATTVNCPAGSGQAKTVTVTSGTSVRLTGLESNARYNIAVVPYTNGGSLAGTRSIKNLDTLSAALPKPSQIQASPLYDGTLPHPNQCKATVNWAADIGNDCMVLQFRVDYTPTNGQKVSSGVLSGVTRSFIISSLKCYTDYEVRVVALSGSAESESEAYDFETPEGKPDRVSSLTITPSSNSAVLSWSAPTPHGVLSQYQITYRRVRYLASCPSNDQTKTRTVPAGTTTYTVTGLSSYSEYQFSVTAYTNNNQNKGLTTWQSEKTTTTVPDSSAAPTKPIVSDAQTTSASVRFHDISCEQRRGSFKAYNYQLTDLSYGMSSRSGDVSTTQLSLTGLTPFTSYNIRYNWASQKGASAWSEQVEFVTEKSAPPAPTITTVDSGPRYINVTVKPPYPPYDYLTSVTVTCRRIDNNQEITNQITVTDNSKEAVVVPFDEVQPSTDYFCSAVVTGSLSVTSSKSEEVRVSTTESEASQPREFRALEITTSSMRLIWITPEAKNGLILRYRYWCRAERTKNPSVREFVLRAPKLESALDHRYTINDGVLAHVTDPITGLWSATQYECHVWAVNGWGPGRITSQTFWTEAESISIGDIVLNYDAGKSNDDSVFIELPETRSPNVEIELYQILVQLISQTDEPSRRKRSADPGLTFEEAQVSGLNVYTAAEWYDSRESFRVGDGQNYSDYYNAPLVKGETYNISYGVSGVVDNKVDYAYVSLSKPVKVGYYPKPVPVGVIAGSVVGAVLFLILVLGVVIGVFVVLPRFRRQKPGTELTRNDDAFEMDDGATNDGAEYAEVRELSSAGPGTVPPVKRYAGSGRGYDPQALLQIVQELTYRPRGFTEEFMGFRVDEFSRKVATRHENDRKNQKDGVLPYDHSRVKLGNDVTKHDDVTDYVNASWIQDFEGQRSYISAQAPMKNRTEADFWKLIWEKDVKVIVMLSAQEAGGEDLGALYWPSQAGEVMVSAGIQVALQTEKQLDWGIIRRDLVLINGGVLRNITQLQYAGWPDQGVPALCAPLLQLRAAVREAAQPDSLTLVHCSYGSGRTGAFIAVDDVLCQHREMGTFNVKDTIQRLLHCRDRMIETDRQFTFVHHCLLESLLLGDTSILKSELLLKLQGKESSSLEYKVMDLMRQARFETNSIGSAKPNQYKNRNPDIIPDDLHRPTLLTQRRENCYINACFVKNLSGSPELLVTQLPLANTVTDLWQLVWDQEINTIVRLDTNKRRMKPGEQYWPTQDRTVTGAFTITFDRCDSTNPAYTVETFKLSKGTSTPRAVSILVFQAWPDNSPVPEFPLSFLHLYKALKTHAADAPTALVQCYDGATKSGLLCATYCLLEELSEKESVSIYQAVRQTQHTRPQFIPDMKQYAFLHAVACEFMELAADEIYSTYMEPTYIQKPDDYINSSQA